MLAIFELLLGLLELSVALVDCWRLTLVVALCVLVCLPVALTLDGTGMAWVLGSAGVVGFVGGIIWEVQARPARVVPTTQPHTDEKPQ